ncbi:MAG: ImmA/IrrE family metallo-endopeptidase [Clostridiales bacterium]|nr:ImmA/IrrE family metallo-endopeptidase [Clostridiales bacterium]
MTNYISRAEAEELCDGLIQQYIGSKTVTPAFVNIDGFVKVFLKCKVVYETIREEEMDRIGFTADGIRPLRVLKSGKIRDIVYPRNTIVLDKYLLNLNECHHRRFVLGHEAGHIIAGRINPDSPACFHRFTDRERMDYSVADMRERYSVLEWQANVIGAALLMPRYVMLNTLNQFNGGRRLPVYGENIFHPREKTILQKMASSLRVSYTALVIRLRDLDMLKRHDVSEYIQKELGLGGGG